MGDISHFSIRTSDRRTFRRCMRKWDYQSSLRQNLARLGTEQNINFWFGSAIHFCMEDYHGYNRFEDPRRALYAYYNAFKPDDRPVGAEMHYSLGLSMLTYYMQWMDRHNQSTEFETLWIEPQTMTSRNKGDKGAIPAVEISFSVPLHVWAIYDKNQDKIVEAFYHDPEKPAKTMEGWASADHCSIFNPLQCGWVPENPPETEYRINDSVYRIIEIQYHGTIDRIVRDKYGRIWLWDYKTAKSADTAKLATDDQVTAYLWAARKVFPFLPYGFIYLQMTKDRVQEPKRLKDGTLSSDKRQKTTYSLVRRAIIEDYDSVQQAPNKLIQFLNAMAAQEEPEGDKFIRWDFVKRSEAQLRNAEHNIYGELNVMLNPHTICYPTPTRDCIWDCPFRDACIMQDDEDSDGLEEFMLGYQKRPHSEDGNMDEWRQGIAWPRVGADGTPVQIPLEDVMSYEEALTPVLNGLETPEDEFKFHYAAEC